MPLLNCISHNPTPILFPITPLLFPPFCPPFHFDFQPLIYLSPIALPLILVFVSQESTETQACLIGHWLRLQRTKDTLGADWARELAWKDPNDEFKSFRFGQGEGRPFTKDREQQGAKDGVGIVALDVRWDNSCGKGPNGVVGAGPLCWVDPVIWLASYSLTLAWNWHLWNLQQWFEIHQMKYPDCVIDFFLVILVPNQHTLTALPSESESLISSRTILPMPLSSLLSGGIKDWWPLGRDWSNSNKQFFHGKNHWDSENKDISPQEYGTKTGDHYHFL